MGQMLAIQGEHWREMEALFRAGLRAFHTVAGIQPADRFLSARTAVAVFPNLRAGPQPRIVHDAGRTKWACAAGTWFHPRACDEEIYAALNPFEPGRFDIDATDGAFALLFGDHRTGEMVVATDRLGSLHCYRTELDGCLLVSTSSLVLAALTRPGWDLESCREFLATGTVFEQRTLFRNIEKLPPATVLRFHGPVLRSRTTYWRLADVTYDRATGGDVPRLAESLERAVGTACRKFRRPAFDLTGGFDSRAVVGAALKAGHRCETVVTGPENHPDVVASARIAREFGLPQRREVKAAGAEETWRNAKAALALCDGECDVLEYAGTLRTHWNVSADFDATINGSVGEIAKGYWWELLFPCIGWRGYFEARKVAARRFATDPRGPDLLAVDYGDGLAEHFAEVIRRANGGFEGHPNTAAMDNVYLTLRMQRWQGRIASATDRIWPCVSPFAFRAPLEAALSAPPGMRVRNRMSRELIEYLNPKLAALPLAQGYPALPVRLGTIHRFGPLAMEIAGKCVSKLVRPAAHAPSNGNSWKRLAQLEEVRSLLDPGSMVTAQLYREAGLRSLVGRSRVDGFGERAQFGRVLTLEMLARAAGVGSSGA